MSRNWNGFLVHTNFNVERLLIPPAIIKELVDLFGDQRFAAARSQDCASLQGKGGQTLTHVLEFTRKVGREDGARVITIFNTIPLADVFGDQIHTHRAARYGKCSRGI